MRREGYEFQVSRPEAITRQVDGHTYEPIEHLLIDTTEPYVGPVTDLVGGRRAQMMNMVNDGRGNVRLEFAIPTRGLIGLRNSFLTATKGNGVIASRLIGFEPFYGAIDSQRTGALVALGNRCLPLANGVSPTPRNAESSSSTRRLRCTRA